MVAFATTHFGNSNDVYSYDQPIEGFEPDRSKIFKNFDGVESKINFSALKKSVESACRGLEQFRILNQNMVESYAGPAYGEPKDKRKRYLYKMQQMVEAYMMLLAANRPKIEITTPHRELQPFAKHFETAVNNMMAEIRLEETIRRWVLDAFFTIGIVKVHRKDSGEVQFENNIWMDPGTPFASNVSIDNFVYDMSAKSYAEWKWAGDMYRIPKSDLEEGAELGMFDPAVVKDCGATSKFWNTSERLQAISTGQAFDDDEFVPMVDLCDIWIAQENCIYTFLITNTHNFAIDPRPLAKMKWDDPNQGPYHVLGFNMVPDNVMPVGPAVVIDELDRLANNVMRKQARQAMRQKDYTIYRPGGFNTARNLQRSNDGGIFEGDPADVSRGSEGGANPQNQLFLQDVLRMIDEQAGNLSALLGLSAQAETATQEELIHTASNRKIGQMQSRVLDATRRLIRSLGLMLWDDEFKSITGEIEIETPIKTYRVASNWGPAPPKGVEPDPMAPVTRKGKFLDYNFEPNVHAMAYSPPMMQAAKLIELMTTLYIPLEQQMMAQGGGINFALLNDKLAGLTNMHYLKDIVTFQNPPPTDEPGPTGGKSGGGRAPTNSTYTRKSIPSGDAQAARDQQGWQQMMSQPQQAGAV